MSAHDDVTLFLRARGLADESVAAGAEGLVLRWEQAARDAEHERYPFGVEDWLDELDGRQMLAEMIASIPGALSGALTARLAEADSRVDASTELAGECLWGAKMAKRMKWSPREHWWYWRRPRAVADDFEGGA
ncbi:MAG: hypothetical protein IPJ04_11820 [Candidatus Eisenbacteria bacterium]|nr:hypothetical protein [Candidatus Eisenbacteria bacterium]